MTSSMACSMSGTCLFRMSCACIRPLLCTWLGVQDSTTDEGQASYEFYET